MLACVSWIGMVIGSWIFKSLIKFNSNLGILKFEMSVSESRILYNGLGFLVNLNWISVLGSFLQPVPRQMILMMIIMINDTNLYQNDPKNFMTCPKRYQILNFYP